MTHFISGNQIKLLRNGAEYFPALEAAIENAVNEVYLQTYIYEADATGQRIGHALKQAAQRGVSVNVLLDGFGCKELSKDYVQELETAGVQSDVLSTQNFTMDTQKITFTSPTP